MRSMKAAMAPRTVAATTKAEALGLRPPNSRARLLTVLALKLAPQTEHHQRRSRRQTITQPIS
jgi:hypothetical protein